MGQQIARRVQAALEDEVKAAAPSTARAQAGPPSLASPLVAESRAADGADKMERETHLSGLRSEYWILSKRSG